MSLFAGLESICKPQARLAEVAWFGLGGPARWLVQPRTMRELVEVVRRCRQAGVAIRPLGRGANVLVPDEGVDAVVVRLDEAGFGRIATDGTELRAGAAADMTETALAAVRAGLGGLERMAGIPGSVGACVRGNAGGRFGEIGSLVAGVEGVDADGRLVQIGADALVFADRCIGLEGLIVTEVRFRLDAVAADELFVRFREVWMFRRNAQPLEERAVGCMFRDPLGHRAEDLIERAGLRGLTCGGAALCPKHPNFFVARPGATTSDVVNLIRTVQDRVRATLGIELVRRIEIW